MVVRLILGFLLAESSLDPQQSGPGEGGDIDFDAVVEVGVPALGAFGCGFPGGEEAVVAVAAFGAGVVAVLKVFEFGVVGFEFLDGGEGFEAVVLAAVLTGLAGFAAEGGEAVAEVGAAELGEGVGIELLGVDEHADGGDAADLVAGEVPNERALLVEAGMGFEKGVLQPLGERFRPAVAFGLFLQFIDHFRLQRGGILLWEAGVEFLPQAGEQGRFVGDGLEADQAVRVRLDDALDEVAKQPVHVLAAFLVAVLAFHLRPDDLWRAFADGGFKFPSQLVHAVEAIDGVIQLGVCGFELRIKIGFYLQDCVEGRSKRCGIVGASGLQNPWPIKSRADFVAGIPRCFRVVDPFREISDQMCVFAFV